MELRHYLAILWQRKWIIVITLLATELVVIFGTLRTVPTYSATTTMRIALASSGSVSYQDYMYADRLMNTYVTLATTTPVLDQLKQRLGLSILPPITVNTVPNTELIQITVDDPEPHTAAIMANTLADVLISQSLELYTGGGKSSLQILSDQVATLEQQVNQARSDYVDYAAKNPNDTAGIQAAKAKLDLEQQMYGSVLDQYEQARLKESQNANLISVVNPAIAPISPSKPNKLLNIGLGFIVGLVGGVGLAFLFENLDSTLYTTDQIEKITRLPSLGKVPQLGRNDSFFNMEGNFAYGEAFRRLRTNILAVEFPIHTLLITSAEPREGKSRIIANLAYFMAQSGRNVVVVDCDLRVPSQHELFKIENKVGLSSVLEQKTTFTKALQSTEFQQVHILASGPLPPNPSELLGSDQMKMLIGQLTHIFDLVIIDAPAALAVADAVVLASMVDAIALVICRGKTSSRAVQTVQAQLSKTKARWIGVIINRAEANSSHYYYKQKKRSVDQ